MPVIPARVPLQMIPELLSNFSKGQLNVLHNTGSLRVPQRVECSAAGMIDG